MADVTLFPGETARDFDADTILQNAIGKLNQVVVVGYDKDDREWYSANVSDKAQVVWMLERAKLNDLRSVDED